MRINVLRYLLKKQLQMHLRHMLSLELGNNPTPKSAAKLQSDRRSIHQPKSRGRWVKMATMSTGIVSGCIREYVGMLG